MTETTVLDVVTAVGTAVVVVVLIGWFVCWYLNMRDACRPAVETVQLDTPDPIAVVVDVGKRKDVYVQWPEVPHADRYQVQLLWQTGETRHKIVRETYLTTTSFTDLSKKVDYVVRVAALAEEDE